MPVSWLGCWAALETSVSHAESAGDRPTKGHLPKRGFGHVAVLGMSQRPIHLPQEHRIAPSKLTGYLLHPSNSQGKAAFFQRMGFSLENWPALQQALLMHAESATLIDVLAGPYGERYILSGPLLTPIGRVPPPLLTAVWMREHSQHWAKLITAYPS